MSFGSGFGVCAYRTEVGRMAEEIVAKGDLIPDDVMLKIITSKLDALHNKVRSHWFLLSDANYTNLRLLHLALDIGRFPADPRAGQASRPAPPVRSPHLSSISPPDTDTILLT